MGGKDLRLRRAFNAFVRRRNLSGGGRRRSARLLKRELSSLRGKPASAAQRRRQRAIQRQLNAEKREKRLYSRIARASKAKRKASVAKKRRARRKKKPKKIMYDWPTELQKLQSWAQGIMARRKPPEEIAADLQEIGREMEESATDAGLPLTLDQEAVLDEINTTERMSPAEALGMADLLKESFEEAAAEQDYESDDTERMSDDNADMMMDLSDDAEDMSDDNAYDMPGGLSENLRSAQGTPMFNDVFERLIRKGEFPEILSSTIKCPSPGDPIRPYKYQNVARGLVSPRTGIERFLCCWRTGSGKTFAMIKILENFFDDPRPKIIIFPTASVARNFYREVYKTPSRYRDYIRSVNSSPDLRTSEIAAILSMKGRRVTRDIEGEGVLKAPLVAFSYTTGGGSTARAGARPFNWRLPQHVREANPYTGCVVICDEVHNMIAGILTNQLGETTSPAELKGILMNYLEPRAIQYRDKIGDLAQNLRTASDAVIVGMTATPIVHDSNDGKMLMSIIKGEGAEGRTNHGYISYFNSLTPLLYPVPSPDMSRPVFVGTEVRPVEMGPATFAAYMEKINAKASSAYTNMAFYKNQALDRRYEQKIGDSMMEEPESIANKFRVVVDDMMQVEGKCLVLVHRDQASHGLELFLRRFCESQGCAGRVGYMYKCLPKEKAKECAARNEAVLSQFNAPDNNDGSRMKIVIADTKDFSEGVSFFKVKHLAMVDPPESWGLYKQQIGRVLRSCDMPGRAINMRMYVSVAPESITLTPSQFSSSKTSGSAGKKAGFTRLVNRILKTRPDWKYEFEGQKRGRSLPNKVTFWPNGLITPDVKAYRGIFEGRSVLDTALQAFHRDSVDRYMYGGESTNASLTTAAPVEDIVRGSGSEKTWENLPQHIRRETRPEDVVYGAYR